MRNAPGAGAAPGEEYTPPSYRPVALPGPLRTVRAVLFGRAPDRRTLAYRLRQFLALVHASPYAGDVTAADPRLTYLPLARGGWELPPGATATPHRGTAGELLVVGTPGPDGDGRTRQEWLVEVIAD